MEHVATVSNLNPSYLELRWVELSWVRIEFWQNNDIINYNTNNNIEYKNINKIKLL